MTDKLNTISYEYHYRNIDTSLVYAQRAYNASKSMDYSAGEAEALNNLAFVYMAKMDYVRDNLKIRISISIARVLSQG